MVLASCVAPKLTRARPFCLREVADGDQSCVCVLSDPHLQIVGWEKIVGWEMGARTCLHVRPGSLTILECRFNKTTHHQQSKQFITLSGAVFDPAHDSTNDTH